MTPQISQNTVYRTGFCGLGHHEGTEPVSSRTGKGLKTCTLIDVCQCECHVEISKMFEAAGLDRVVRPNPKYEPYLRTYYMPDPAEIQAAKQTRLTPERDLSQPYDERAARGQLEFFVHRICLEWFEDMSRHDEMTTKHIADLVQAELETEKPPSQGAVHAILMRWEKINFATIGRNPIRFLSPTPEGMTQGLKAMSSSQNG